MFDRVSDAAEKLATNVSRRAFLGRLGKGALTLAGAMGALLALPGMARAGACGCLNGNGFCCVYTCANGSQIATGPWGNCRCHARYQGCALFDWGCICSV